MLEELQKYINNKFCVLADKVKKYVDAKTSGSASDITEQDITNWDTAFSQSHTHSNKATLDTIDGAQVATWNNASNLYFPKPGGTLTGTAGAAHVGFPNQASNPNAPADGFKLFANNGSNPSFLFFNNFYSEFVFNLGGANRTYTFPGVSASANILLSEGSQTINGANTFSASITAAGASFTANIAPSTNGNRTNGTTSLQWLAVYSSQFLGNTGFVNFGTNATSGGINFRQGSTTNVAGSYANTGAFYFSDIVAPGTEPTGANIARLYITHSRTAASGVARGVALNNTLTAAANNDVLVSLDVNTTFTNGAFTGVGNYSIRTSGAIVPATDNAVDMGKSTLRWSGVFSPVYTAGTTMQFRSAASSSFQFQKTGSTDITAIMFGSTNNWYFQGQGTVPTENNYRVTVDGLSNTASTAGALLVTGNTSLNGGVKNKVTSSAASTLTLDANNTVYSFTGTTATWTLPVVAGNTGLMLILINRGSGTITLNQAGGGSSDIYDSGANTTSISLVAGSRTMILNDGAKYVTL